MLLKKHNIIILIIIPSFLALSYGICQCVAILASNDNTTTKTFKDSKTGISFQYPSDWQVASNELVNAVYGNTSNNTTTPIVMLNPSHFNGDSFSIISDLLPFPMSSEKYMKSGTLHILSDPSKHLGNTTSINIGKLNGYKYDISSANFSLPETQIVFTKDSHGFVIDYGPGFTNQSKDAKDIDSIINSFSIK